MSILGKWDKVMAPSLVFKVAKTMLVLIALNWGVFCFVSVYLGGNPSMADGVPGRYYLHNHGAIREVTRLIYERMQLYQTISLSLLAVGFLSLAICIRLDPNGPDVGPKFRRGK